MGSESGQGLLRRYLAGLKPLSLVYFSAFFLAGSALARCCVVANKTLRGCRLLRQSESCDVSADWCARYSIGPTMLLLAESTESSTSQVAMLFPARSCACVAPHKSSSQFAGCIKPRAAWSVQSFQSA